MEKKWRNPNEVMKTRKKKLQRRLSTQNPNHFSLAAPDKENSCLSLSSPSLSLTATSSLPGGEGGRTPLALRSTQDNPPPRTLLSTKRVAIDSGDTCSPQAKKSRCTHLSEHQAEPPEEGSPPSGDEGFPLDWTLKTKARFTSTHPFSWASSIKTHQEAEGVASFVRGLKEDSLEPQPQLRHHLLVWAHPSLPFLRLYPRMETRLILANASTTQSSATAVAGLLQDQHVLQALKDDWATSFQSVFHLLRTGHCPYFYLCGNTYTALFRANGVAASPQPTAFLTPTSSGLRQALRREGVEFSLPLAPSSPSESEEPVGLDDSDPEDDSTASSWLQSMGLHIEDQTGAPDKITLQKARSVSIDNRPESMVIVRGSHLHALVNFLLTSKTTVATTGALAGIPPTLLAPVAFEGASLKALKVKQGTIQEHVEGKLTRLHFLDVTGPVLPHTLHGLCRLFQRTQRGSFTVHFNSNESTTVFNCSPGQKQENSSAHSSVVPVPHESYLSLPPVLNRKACSELKCTDSLYTWVD